MIKTSAKLELQGSSQLNQIFGELNAPSQAKVIEHTFKKAGQQLAKVMKTYAKEAGKQSAKKADRISTGNLVRSIGVVTKRNNRTGSAFAAVGPTKGLKGPDGEYPTRYAHLVNNGKRNRDGSRTKGVKFIERAEEATSGQLTNTIEREYRTGLFKEVDRLRRKYGSHIR